jgi:DNA replication protein
MLLQNSIEKLKKLRLSQMALHLENQEQSESYRSLDFSERLSLLLDLEIENRNQKALQNRLKQAQFRLDACLEDWNHKASRQVSKAQILELSQ